MLISFYESPPEVGRQWDKHIRNYHAVRNEVHDKTSGLKLSYKQIVERNDLSEMIDARRLALIDKN